MKKIISCTLVFLLVSVSVLFPAFSAEETAEQKAQEIHGLASSDVMHTDQELKALYYQNVQIIELLKEIRDLLQQQLQKE